jgi:hypothetical protein
MAWLAAVKRYPFLFELAATTLRAKLEIHFPVLRSSDFNDYVSSQSTSFPRLALLQKSSLDKVRRVSLLMLREAGLLHKGEDLGTLQRPVALRGGASGHTQRLPPLSCHLPCARTRNPPTDMSHSLEAQV